MSNDKQSMKLYTEEQVLNTVEAIRNYLKNYPEKFHESMIKKHLMNLTPIELPSDEEIIKNGIKPLHGLMDEWDKGFLFGAKLMHFLIQGCNNEQR